MSGWTYVQQGLRFVHQRIFVESGTTGVILVLVLGVVIVNALICGSHNKGIVSFSASSNVVAVLFLITVTTMSILCTMGLVHNDKGWRPRDGGHAGNDKYFCSRKFIQLAVQKVYGVLLVCEDTLRLGRWFEVKSIIVREVGALRAHSLYRDTGGNNYNRYRASYRSTYGADYNVTGRRYRGTSGWFYQCFKYHPYSNNVFYILAWQEWG